MSLGPYNFKDSSDRGKLRSGSKKGFQLRILVCGRPGTGKSTFINTLCDGEIYSPQAQNGDSFLDHVLEPTKEIEVHTHSIDLGQSDGTVISLTVIDTPGFGSQINNKDSHKSILKYLEDSFDSVLMEEIRIHRNPKFEDNRVHVCLYFIPPTGGGLRELDIELMSALSPRVNLIPVIAKADTMTDSELLEFKQQVSADIINHQIDILEFTYDSNDGDSREEAMALREMMPFAVVGSNSIYQIGDEYLRGRNYPWGFVRVEDPMHNDFVALRSVLFASHIQELRDSTEHVIYERYRSEKLCEDPKLMAKLQEKLQTDIASSTIPLSLSGTLAAMGHVHAASRSYSRDKQNSIHDSFMAQESLQSSLQGLNIRPR